MATIEQQGKDLKNALDFFWEVVEGTALQQTLDAQGGLGLGSRIHLLVSKGWRVERPRTVGSDGPKPACPGCGLNDTLLVRVNSPTKTWACRLCKHEWST